MDESLRERRLGCSQCRTRELASRAGGGSRAARLQARCTEGSVRDTLRARRRHRAGARFLCLECAAIRALDEHWDGHGQPLGLRGEEIPLLGRIVCLAQSTDAFTATYGLAAAYRMARERRGTWFDPAVVGALEAIEEDRAFWAGFSAGHVDELVGELEPVERAVHVDAAGLDRVAGAFARVIDAKSPFTASHSERVAEIALGIGVVVPVYTRELLGRVAAFRELADDASDHHEKLDGSGYPRGLREDELTQTARILAVADIFEAMTAARPYRGPLPIGTVLETLDADAGSRLDGGCVAALRSWVELAVAA